MVLHDGPCSDKLPLSGLKDEKHTHTHTWTNTSYRNNHSTTSALILTPAWYVKDIIYNSLRGKRGENEKLICGVYYS